MEENVQLPVGPVAPAPYDMLHPTVKRWVWQQGWPSLKPIQTASIAPILQGGNDVVISASTTGGKTEAAFLPILSSLLSSPSESEGFSVLALAPLKALINDQTRRLEDMTRDTDIDVTPWHGDVAASQKAGASRRPSGILYTTPESLEAILALRGPWARSALAHLRYVVIDELHSFMDSERGKQLQSLLARVELLTKRPVPRIAMSATFSDVGYVKRFLRPDGSLPCVIPSAGNEAHPVQIAIKEYVADAQHEPEPIISSELFARLRGTNNLVFTNSRKEAEAFMVSLSKMSEEQGVPNEFRIHHGSLSRADREAVEKDLQKGHHPVTAICTASMELGVDIGKVKSIAQIGTAVSPSTLRQRLGRSGRRGEPSVIRIYSVDEMRDDYKFHLRANLVQNIAVTELLRERVYDAAPSDVCYLSVIVQQLESLLSQLGSFYEPEAFQLLCSQGAFAMFTREKFSSLITYLIKKGVLSQLATGQIVIGSGGERMLRQRDFFSAFTTPKDYTIIDSKTRKTVGNVQYKPYYGEIFILAGSHWIVDAVEEKSSTVYVSATHSKGKMMFEGTGPEISSRVTRKMLDIYKSEALYPYLDAATATPQQLEAARQWFKKKELATTHFLRNGETLTLLTWGGMKVNRSIALMANAWLSLNPPYDHLGVNNLSASNIEYLAQRIADEKDPQALATDMARWVNRRKKEQGKWDVYLPDPLLDQEYASRKLAFPDAQKILLELPQEL
ncbi:MAG: DEAD/DEAH box helicase [Bacteroidales bacterium]|nr:DEAD/DEAH box helicase [Bacteroidales bacterium]